MRRNLNVFFSVAILLFLPYLATSTKIVICGEQLLHRVQKFCPESQQYGFSMTYSCCGGVKCGKKSVEKSCSEWILRIQQEGEFIPKMVRNRNFQGLNMTLPKLTSPHTTNRPTSTKIVICGEQLLHRVQKFCPESHLYQFSTSYACCKGVKCGKKSIEKSCSKWTRRIQQASKIVNSALRNSNVIQRLLNSLLSTEATINRINIVNSTLLFKLSSKLKVRNSEVCKGCWG